jgi:hypothetical protein
MAADDVSGQTTDRDDANRQTNKNENTCWIKSSLEQTDKSSHEFSGVFDEPFKKKI